MKRLLLAAMLLCSLVGQAAPGDTTWVQAHYNKWLDYYNNFDTTVEFPKTATTYRKIIMVFTLGKYACPGSPTYCADWDYTVQNFLMNKRGDTLELGRLITPYGKGPRMGTAPGWTQNYYFDVTDLAPALKDSNTIRILYSGYSGGFTANIRFAMIEGTPERNVLGVKKVWAGSFPYGSSTNPIDSHFPLKSLTAPAGTAKTQLAFNVTGHGSDPNYCSEFCSKYYRVVKNGSVIDEKQIWRANCGSNNLYPQSGTWVYDRGNWCPGAQVYTNYHDLGVSGATSFDLNMNFEPYSSSGSASYTTYATVIYYGAMNKSLDASLEDIIAPTNNPNYFRSNSRTGNTTIKLRNSGSSAISSVTFEYGVSGQPLRTYTWTGTLASEKDTIIDLPFVNSLLAASGTNVPYEVNIIKVNGASDDDATNNRLTTSFTAAPEWASVFLVTFSTNKATNISGFAETSWYITDLATNAVVASRMNNTPSTAYNDSVKLGTGVYKLTVVDEGCDGLSFWANTAAGSGFIRVKPTLFTTYTLEGYFSADFGCGFDQYFRVGIPTAIREINTADAHTLQVFPNPASDVLSVHIESTTRVSGELSLCDYTGRVVYRAAASEGAQKIDVSGLSQGVYFVSFTPSNPELGRLQEKVVILK